MRDPVAIGHRLSALGAQLTRWREVWAHRPFASMPAPWEHADPEAAQWLRQLDDAQFDAIAADPTLLSSAPAPLSEWQSGCEELSRVSVATPRDSELRPRGVRPRKWAQVSALAPLLTDAAPGGSWVDWCSGKGHLGRTLAQATARPVRFVERRAALCESAVARATADGVKSEAFACDVLRTTSSEALLVHDGDAVVALHSCGDLGDAALDAADAGGARFVALAPCCYHFRPSSGRLTARTSLGRRFALEIDSMSLRFATAEEVVATPRRRLRRKRVEAYRQGLDILLRQATGEDRYQRVPHVPAAWVDGSFAAFIKRMREQHQLPLPERFDAAEVERRGHQRAQLASRLSLARAPFRRVLELWMVLDRALWLAERGWQVAVEAFCERSVSPRNLLIVAQRD
jgi:hypothetical protein